MRVNETEHASDGDLMRLVDSRLAGAADSVGAHVARCTVCAERLARYDALSRGLSRLVSAANARIGPPPPLRAPDDGASRRRSAGVDAAPRSLWHRPAIRAAAAVIVLAAIAAASPVGTWIVERLMQVDRAPVQSGPPRDEPATPAVVAAMGPRIGFDVVGERLTVSLERRQASGTLEIIQAGGSRAAAQIVTGMRDESLLVLPSELRIRNHSVSVASYEMVVPRGVRVVAIQVADGPIVRAIRTERDGRWTVALSDLP